MRTITFDDLVWEKPHALKFYSEIADDGKIVAVWQTKTINERGYEFASRITATTSRLFQLFSDGQLQGGKESENSRNDLAIWEARERFQKIEMSEESGHGYSGGHNTATQRGWSTWTPNPKEYCVMHQDITRQGQFTGYWPKTRSYTLVV